MVSKRNRRQDLGLVLAFGLGTLGIDALLVGGVCAWLFGLGEISLAGIAGVGAAIAALFVAQMAVVTVTSRVCAAARRVTVECAEADAVSEDGRRG